MSCHHYNSIPDETTIFTINVSSLQFNRFHLNGAILFLWHFVFVEQANCINHLKLMFTSNVLVTWKFIVRAKKIYTQIDQCYFLEKLNKNFSWNHVDVVWKWLKCFKMTWLICQTPYLFTSAQLWVSLHAAISQSNRTTMTTMTINSLWEQYN